MASQTTSLSHMEQLYLYRQLHLWTPEQSLAYLPPTVLGSPKTWAPQLEPWHFWSLISCHVDAGVRRMPFQSRIFLWPSCIHVKVNPEDKCACYCGSRKFCQQLWLPCPALEINHTPHFISRGFPELSGYFYLSIFWQLFFLIYLDMQKLPIPKIFPPRRVILLEGTLELVIPSHYRHLNMTCDQRKQH